MKKKTKVAKTNKVVALALEPQLRIWKSKDGRETRMCDMSDTHVMHALYLLKRNAMKALLEFINNNNRNPSKFLGMGGQHFVTVHDEVMSVCPARVVCDNRPQPTLEEAYAKKDVATGMTWRDFTDAYFYPLLLEAYRRLGLTTYTNEMLNTDKLRFAQ